MTGSPPVRIRARRMARWLRSARVASKSGTSAGRRRRRMTSQHAASSMRAVSVATAPSVADGLVATPTEVAPADGEAPGGSARVAALPSATVAAAVGAASPLGAALGARGAGAGAMLSAARAGVVVPTAWATDGAAVGAAGALAGVGAVVTMAAAEAGVTGPGVAVAIATAMSVERGLGTKLTDGAGGGVTMIGLAVLLGPAPSATDGAPQSAAPIAMMTRPARLTLPPPEPGSATAVAEPAAAHRLPPPPRRLPGAARPGAPAR